MQQNQRVKRWRRFDGSPVPSIKPGAPNCHRGDHWEFCGSFEGCAPRLVSETAIRWQNGRQTPNFRDTSLAQDMPAGTDGPEPSVVAAFPLVVEYEAAFLGRAADEIEALPPNSAIVDMLGDYAVVREQAGGF